MKPDRLQCFLYLLMRDKLPAGTLETVCLETEKPGVTEFIFSNKPLAKYAKELAKRLRREGMIKP